MEFLILKKCLFYPKNIYANPLLTLSTSRMFNTWKSYKDDIDIKKISDYPHIIIYDNFYPHGNYLGQKLRKVLKLDKKDKNKKKYLIVIPNSEYFNTKFIKKCFKKSRKLINKKYFFVDYNFYGTSLLGGRIQEIINIVDNTSPFLL